MRKSGRSVRNQEQLAIRTEAKANGELSPYQMRKRNKQETTQNQKLKPKYIFTASMFKGMSPNHIKRSIRRLTDDQVLDLMENKLILLRS